jgi:hypothetical protein
MPRNFVDPKSLACIEDNVQIAYEVKFGLNRISIDDVSLKDHRAKGDSKHSTLNPRSKPGPFENSPSARQKLCPKVTPIKLDRPVRKQVGPYYVCQVLSRL